MSTASLSGFGGSSAAPRRTTAPRLRVTAPRLRMTAPRLRMTARGRAVLTTLVAAPLVAAAIFVGLNAGGATATSTSTPLSTVTVTSGETLWQVARHLDPTADPRDVVADLMNVNQLTSADIVPGEQLKVPAKYGH